MKPALMDALKVTAHKRGLPVSNVVRMALVQFIQESKALGD